jgi:hypothetical protein
VQPHDQQPAPPPYCTFSADPTHPDRLRCDACGEPVGAIDPCAEPAGDPPPLGLTVYQAVRRWPELAEAIRRHEALCTWRRSPPPEGGAGVYVHLYPREGDDR